MTAKQFQVPRCQIDENIIHGCDEVLQEIMKKFASFSKEVEFFFFFFFQLNKESIIQIFDNKGTEWRRIKNIKNNY